MKSFRNVSIKMMWGPQIWTSFNRSLFLWR